ncbi:hypothetical protein Tco_1211561 [Tanacetum coccineum]
MRPRHQKEKVFEIIDNSKDGNMERKSGEKLIEDSESDVEDVYDETVTLIARGYDKSVGERGDEFARGEELIQLSCEARLKCSLIRMTISGSKGATSSCTWTHNIQKHKLGCKIRRVQFIRMMC